MRSIWIILFTVLLCSFDIYGQSDTLSKRLTIEEIYNMTFEELFHDDSLKQLDVSKGEVILTIYGKPSKDIIIGKWELYSKMGKSNQTYFMVEFNSNGLGYVILPDNENIKFEWELTDFSLVFNWIDDDNCFGFNSCYCLFIEKGEEIELILSQDIEIIDIKLKEFKKDDGSIIYEVYDNKKVYKLRKHI